MNNNNNDVTKKYGLFTAITMIVGICIGSGIFFKSDNVLKNIHEPIKIPKIIVIDRKRTRLNSRHEQ